MAIVNAGALMRTLLFSEIAFNPFILTVVSDNSNSSHSVSYATL